MPSCTTLQGFVGPHQIYIAASNDPFVVSSENIFIFALTSTVSSGGFGPLLSAVGGWHVNVDLASFRGSLLTFHFLLN